MNQSSLHKNFKRQGYRSFLAGAFFGLCFPVIGTVILSYEQGVGLGDWWQIHLNNSLLQIIDTAPLFLGLFAYFIGTSQAKTLKSQHLRQIENEAFNTKLSAQNKDLKELTRILDDLIYTASHDLKTPIVNLKSMITMMRMLKDSPHSSEKMDQVLNRMEVATDRFDTTINDLLDLSRVDSYFEGGNRELGLREFTQDVLAGLNTDIERSQAIVTLDIPESATLFWPEASLTCVLQNLISNSLKFQSEDRIPEITIRSHRMENEIRLDVQDNGRGIDLNKNRKKLFRIFKRIEQSDNSGIGLYLIKRIIDKAGGRIDVESTPGQGTCFSVFFPTTLAG